MYVKSLTLRGFKSFASATTLQFTPGIICVVGPNGSGKSNIVDALAWVMGEQGAKNLRGGSMADVIFAGTSSRSSLGRAEVALTIDNTSGDLPIDYSEVTISRTLFRQGGSEYAINGTPCRLLDIQELLSDTGMGRNMHVIIGQGKLDQVLSADPSQRRSLIEEAAGVLKHQRRKERALRKLDGLEEKLSRLSDLTQEIQRQLGPLARQAKTARRAAVLQAQARDAGCRILADDLQQMSRQLSRYKESGKALEVRREELGEKLALQHEKLQKLTADATQNDLAGKATNLWQQLTAITERLRALEALANERASSLAKPEPVPAGPSVEERQRQLAHLQSELATHDQDTLAKRKQADAAEAAREETTRKVGDQVRITQELREEAQQKTQKTARLEREVETAKARLEAADSRIQRAQKAQVDAQEKLEVARVKQQAAGETAPDSGMDAAGNYRQLSEAENQVRTQLEKARDRLRESEAKAVAASESKASLSEVLAASSNQAESTFAQAAKAGGQLASLITVPDCWEDAIAALLGRSGSALTIESAQLEAGLMAVKDSSGSVSWVVGDPGDEAVPLSPTTGNKPGVPIPAREVISAPSGLHPALNTLLENSYLAENLTQAQALVADNPQVRVGLKDGTIIGKYLGETGSGGVNRIEVERRLRLARKAAQVAEATKEKARVQVKTAEEALSQAAAASAQALKVLRQADAQAAAKAQERALTEAAVSGAESQEKRAAAELAQAKVDFEKCRQQLEAAEKARDAFSGNADLAPLQQAEQDLEAARAADLAAREKAAQAHLELAAATQITNTLRERFQGEVKSLERFQLRLAARSQREIERARQSQRMLQVASWCEVFAQRSASVAQVAKTWRESAEAARAASSQAAEQVRSEIDRLNIQLAELNDLSRRDEVAAAEYRVRAEQLTQQAQERYALSPQELIAAFGPQQLVPDPELLAQRAENAQEEAVSARGEAEEGETESANETADGAGQQEREIASSREDGAAEPEEGRWHPYNRAEQSALLEKANRAISRLGKVNPLALEEHQALEKRFEFLMGQLTDLRTSKADLLVVVREVDHQVKVAFEEAYADISREFTEVFSRLFPGGTGSLKLTDPDDMLTTGVEVNARPAGKNVQRLSLLSGGERSLAALAFLIAIFKARPSPFYILDEVEAALDDLNLSRMLELFKQLREVSQMIVITHQKRTMEVADVLYGVTMREGVSRVISQRLEPADS